MEFSHVFSDPYLGHQSILVQYVPRCCVGCGEGLLTSFTNNSTFEILNAEKTKIVCDFKKAFRSEGCGRLFRKFKNQKRWKSNFITSFYFINGIERKAECFTKGKRHGRKGILSVIFNVEHKTFFVGIQPIIHASTTLHSEGMLSSIQERTAASKGYQRDNHW